MDIRVVSQIDGNRHSRLVQAERAALRLAQLRPFIIRRGCKAGQLYKQKWKIAFCPARAPVLDQSSKQSLVVERTLDPSVALPLVPKCATNRKFHQWRNHPVEVPTRQPGTQLGMPGK